MTENNATDVTKAVLKELGESRIKVTPELVEAVTKNEQPLYDPAFNEEQFIDWKERYKAWQKEFAYKDDRDPAFIAELEAEHLEDVQKWIDRGQYDSVEDYEERMFWEDMMMTRTEYWYDPEKAGELMDSMWRARAADMGYEWSQKHRKLTQEEAEAQYQAERAKDVGKAHQVNLEGDETVW